KKTYEAMYIAMKPEQDMKIPVKDIRQMLDEKYADEEIPYYKFDSGRIIDSQDHISVLEYTESENIDYSAGSAGEFIYDGDSAFTLSGAYETLMDANATAGGNVGVAIHLLQPMTEGYNITFTFTDSDGNDIPVVLESDEPNDSETLFVSVRGLIGASDISVTDITKLTITGNDLSYIEISTGDSGYYEHVFAQNDSSVDADEVSDNPGTGADVAQMLLLTVAAGAAAVIFRKHRDTEDR
ncbi:MAG: hypothetical protein J6X60_10215, partial [Ruminiclostridium sp.]|nr:hypothetical protein [Ruminiclostridium sp.]